MPIDETYAKSQDLSKMTQTIKGLCLKVYVKFSRSRTFDNFGQMGYGLAVCVQSETTFWPPNQNGKQWGVCVWTLLSWSA